MEINTGVYKHFKGGFVYVLFTAKHSDREEIVVVYKGLNNGKFYARPIESFIEIVNDSEGKETQRFIFIKKEDWNKSLSNDQIQEINKLSIVFN